METIPLNLKRMKHSSNTEANALEFETEDEWNIAENASMFIIVLELNSNLKDMFLCCKVLQSYHVTQETIKNSYIKSL